MSSNHQHTNNTIITRSNYEEYFLLYVDEELTAEEKSAVEAFLLLHPDLQDEMDVLLSTKLTPTAFTFDDKQALFADSMKATVVDEALLLYIDDELPQAQKNAVEEKLQHDKEYSLQHALLAKTKLDPTEKIIYPNKEELYRKTERRLPMYWRVAAAAVIILWAGTFDWRSTDSNSTTGPVASQLELPATKAPEATATTTTTTAPGTATTVTEAPVNNTIAAAPAATATPTNAVNKSEIKSFSTTAATVENTVVVSQPAVDVTIAKADVPTVAIAPQQIINNPVVTSAAPERNISTTAAIETTPVPVEAVATTADHEKGGSFKGFLRKATRMIERRTGIDATNGDDELLIGAVAIKLK